MCPAFFPFHSNILLLCIPSWLSDVTGQSQSPPTCLLCSRHTCPPLQIIFAVVIPAVTSTVLDKSNGDCYLNLIPGRVCE